MDSVHDMGGVDGFGKVEVEKNEPVFHAAWEGRVFAIQRAMAYGRGWNIDQSRFAQEQLPPITYLSASYYQRWLLGMEKNIVERGFATAEELKAGHATGAGKMLRRKLTVSLNDWWRWVIDFGAPGPDRLRRATAARRILCRALPHYSRLDPWSNVSGEQRSQSCGGTDQE